MPTYAYECEACGHGFELFQNMSARAKRKCPECGKLKLKRLIGTGSAVIFKGGGFYETDYRSDAYKKSAEKDKKSAEGKKDDAKGGDAKPKAKSDGGSSTKKTTESGGSKPAASKSSGSSKD